MRLFKTLHKKLDYLTDKQIQRIHQAYLTALAAHAGQKRDSGEVFISHPVAVANILADIHMDTESIMAALLHDVIEDTSLDKSTVIKKFGKSVADLVDGVTKLTKMQFSSVAEAQAENFRKMILAMSQDIRVILVKLADRLHNMRTIDSLPDYKRRRIAKETLDIYAPIANRLGIHDLYIELENLGFAALYPRRYKVIQEAVKKARGNRKEITGAIKKELKRRLVKGKLAKAILLGREKQIYSIYKKMVRKRLSLEEVMDIYAFRIIVDSVDDCYRALGIVHSLYKPMPGKFEDYIAIPKVNGYQSLHTILLGPNGVPIEIQIRTKQMNQMAKHGIAAHWLYKSGEKIDKSHIQAQQWVNELLEMQQSTGNALEFIENVKIDLFPDEIYVFTPKGKITKLARGSTAVDFAYAVHTDVGNSCVSAKVDFQFAPLSTVLQNGQTVSIMTAPGARPNPAWLNFVATGKARSSIRHFLKNQQRSESIALGKELLGKALANLSLNINKISKATFNAVLQTTKLTSLNALYEDIGLGNRIPAFVAHQLINASKYKDVVTKKVTKPQEKPMLIAGAEGMAVHFANCCCPIPGDPIVGYMSAGRGLTIHTEKCRNIAKLRQQPEQCILVRWADDVKGDFSVLIDVEMSSKRGAFAELTKAISDSEASLEDITINKRTGEHYSVTLRLYVRNRDHLNKVLRRINNLKIVTTAARI
jgi:guanosine-3',5'-bis(diphosphate) 3'-pyrophosphohydrolase